MCFVKVAANALPSDGHAERDVQPCRTEFHSAVAERDRLGCFNVPGVLAAAEPGAARAKLNPDRWDRAKAHETR